MSAWDKLRLRLENCAYAECRGRGVSVISVRLMLRNGELVQWTKPAVTPFEPAENGEAGLEDVDFSDELMEAAVAP